MGQIKLPLLKATPTFLDKLLSYQGGQPATVFRQNIRAYNMNFAMTSIGGTIDKSINNGTAPYVFKLGGQNYHKIGSLLPPLGSNQSLHNSTFMTLTMKLHIEFQQCRENRTTNLWMQPSSPAYYECLIHTMYL